MSDEEMYRLKDFEVRVTIIKAEQLAGLDIDPVIRVDVGEFNRYTSISQSTNCPYFNDYMVFDFRATPAIIFDKIITISVSYLHVAVDILVFFCNLRNRFVVG
jgi:hypothetical protein